MRVTIDLPAVSEPNGSEFQQQWWAWLAGVYNSLWVLGQIRDLSGSHLVHIRVKAGDGAQYDDEMGFPYAIDASPTIDADNDDPELGFWVLTILLFPPGEEARGEEILFYTTDFADDGASAAEKLSRVSRHLRTHTSIPMLDPRLARALDALRDLSSQYQ